MSRTIWICEDDGHQYGKDSVCAHCGFKKADAIRPVHVTGTNKVNTEEPACSYCNGSGTVNGRMCISCGGNGDGDIW